MRNPQRVFLMVFVGCTLGLLTVKGWLRPRVLANEGPHWLEVFVLSFPNFCEAVLGSFLVLGILQTLNNRLLSDARRGSRATLVVLTFLIAGSYVISQEMKLHHLGGHNVYDPNDLVFSIAGLLVSAAFFWCSGYELDWRASTAGSDPPS